MRSQCIRRAPRSPQTNSRTLFSLFGCINPCFSPASQGNVTFSCAEPVFLAVTFNGPKSFLSLPGQTEPQLMGTSIRLQFRTWNEAGLLLVFNLPMHSGAVWLYLNRARLHLLIHKAGRAPLELSAGQILKPSTLSDFRILWAASPFSSYHLRFGSE